MNLTIFNPAPLGDTLTKWGDYHFGHALQRALEALGARVTQRYWPDWTQDDAAEVHLVLRGKRVFPEAHRRPAILWMMSHPSSVSRAELAAYDFVLLGSQRHLSLLGEFARGGEFEVARQCTEFDSADAPAVPPARDRHGIIFVANSRGVRRPVLRWALELGVPVELYGRHWSAFGLRRMVRSEYVENEALGPLYRQSLLALNDHWTDMQYFGYINNRVFDSMACGLPVITDDFAELREVFADSLLYARDRADFLDCHVRFTRDYAGLRAALAERWTRIGPDYTFAARARRIADIAQRLRAARRPPARSAPPPPPPSAAQSELAGLLAGLTGARVLHVMPACHLDSIGILDERVGYLTAGVGSGPWTVDIDETLSAFSAGSFNTIIVDDVGAHELADALDARVFAQALTKSLRPGGRVFVHADASLVRQARPGWARGSLERASANYLEYRAAAPGDAPPAPAAPAATAFGPHEIP